MALAELDRVADEARGLWAEVARLRLVVEAARESVRKHVHAHHAGFGHWTDDAPEPCYAAGYPCYTIGRLRDALRTLDALAKAEAGATPGV